MASTDTAATGPSGSAGFSPTRWTVVLTAARSDTTQAREALTQLCRMYWYPLYGCVRRRGYSPPDAEDLTQAFFARVLAEQFIAAADQAKGRFRSFLLTRLNHFLADEWDREQAQKRGGGHRLIPLEGGTAVWGAVWALVFAAEWVWVDTRPGRALTQSLRGFFGRGVVDFVQAGLMVVAFAAPVGVTVRGWIAVRDIRRSGGRLRGLPLAVLDLALLPLLVASGWLVWLYLRVTAQVTGLPAAAWSSVAGIALVLGLALLLVGWLWRRLQHPLPAPTPGPAAPATEAPFEAGWGRRLWWVIGRATLVGVVQLCLLESSWAMRSRRWWCPVLSATTRAKPACFTRCSCGAIVGGWWAVTAGFRRRGLPT
jgi:DNA-directed RNA polymerase specialized sigma24 family protein